MNKGALHRRLGIPQGQPIPSSTIRADLARAKKSGDVRDEKQDVEALNFRAAGRRRRKGA